MFRDENSKCINLFCGFVSVLKSNVQNKFKRTQSLYTAKHAQFKNDFAHSEFIIFMRQILNSSFKIYNISLIDLVLQYFKTIYTKS